MSFICMLHVLLFLWQTDSITSWGNTNLPFIQPQQSVILHAAYSQPLLPVTVPIYSLVETNEIEAATSSTTQKPTESTTPSNHRGQVVPEKIISLTPPPQKKAKLVQDVHIIRAIQTEDTNRFIIESIKLAPGARLIRLPFNERFQSTRLIKLPVNQQRPTRLVKLPLKYKQQKSGALKQQPRFARVLVPVAMATGSTAADKPVPRVPDLFGNGPSTNNGDTSLILEPSARAIVGNGGTAISSPLSRAYIRPGTITRILFRPDSVAIAGPGGRAHASADLILNYLKSK